jgi:threonine aldolase
MDKKYSFLDDYSEGAHPRILEALMRTNLLQETGYGYDHFSQQAKELIKEKIGNPNARIF